MQSKYSNKAILFIGILLLVLFAVPALTLLLVDINAPIALEQIVLCAELIVLLYFSVALLRLKQPEDSVLSGSPVKRWLYENQRTAAFLLLFFFAQGFALAYAAGSHGQGFSPMFFYDKNDSFMDFFHSLCTAKADEGYLGGSIYPPLAYIFFLAFGRFVPWEMFQNYSESYTQRDAAFAIRASQEGRMVFMLFLIGAIFLFIMAVSWAKKSGNTSKLLLAFGLLVSSPFLFAIERGNIIMYSLFALLVFISFYRSQNKWLRELALVALAFATALKLVPVFFAVLLLIDKRYRDLLRFAVYTLLLFLLPFALFGGFAQIPVFVQNLLRLVKQEVISSEPTHRIALSFAGAFDNIAALTSAGTAAPFTDLLAYGFMALILVCSFFAKGWKKVLGVTLAMCSFAPTNAQYEMVYLIIPLIMFLNDQRKKDTDGLYLFLFVVMFAFFPSYNITNVKSVLLHTVDHPQYQTLSVFLQNFALLFLALLFISDVVYERHYASLRAAKTAPLPSPRKLRKQLTGGETLALFCAGMMALFVAAASVLNAVPFWQAGLYWLYQLFSIWLPGLAFIRLLKIRPQRAIVRFGLGYAVGYVLNIFWYILSIPLSFLTASWMVAIPILNITAAVLSVVYFTLLRRKKADVPTVFEKKEGIFFLLLWGAVFLLYFVALGMPNRLPGMGEQAYYVDTLYWLGNAISLSRDFPPESMRGVGEIIYYHYFTSMQLVVAEKTIGLPLQTLGLAFSYLQSTTLIVFGFYLLFETLFKSRLKVGVSFLLLLFSQGLYEQTGVFITSHILTGPFGFDYSMALMAFALWVLIDWLRGNPIRLNTAVLNLLLFIGCLGCKGPIGFVLLFAEGCICLWLLIKRKQVVKILCFGVVTLIVFAAVYLTFMSAGLSWFSDSSSGGTTGGGGFSLSLQGTANFSPIIRKFYSESAVQLPRIQRAGLAFLLILEYLFHVNMAMFFLCAVRFFKMLKNIQKTDAIQWICFAVIAVAAFLTLFLSMVGGSQVYFIEIALVFVLIFAFYKPKGESSAPAEKQVFYRKLTGVAVAPLILGCVFSAWHYAFPIMKDAFITIDTGVASITSRFDYNINSNILNPEEKEGYDWLQKNTDEDAILITNATIYSEGPLMTNVFTERRLWVESNRAPSVSREEADIRIALIKAFMEGDPASIAPMQEADVDYVIILTRYRHGGECVSDLDLVYSNPAISIYALGS